MRRNPSHPVVATALGIALATCCCAAESRAAAVFWSSPNSGDWNDVTRWSSNPLLPGPSDDVTINSKTLFLGVTHSSGIHTVRSLTSNEILVISGGSLTIAGSGVSNSNGLLSIAGGVLIASGAKTSLSANGGTFFSSGAIRATNGATFSLPGLTSHTGGGVGSGFEASGSSNSKLDLSGLTSFSGGTGSALDTVDAFSGGVVEMPNVPSITSGRTSFFVDGTGSRVNLDNLTTFTATGSTFLVQFGGTIHAPSLTNASGGVALVAYGTTSSLNMPLLSNVNGSSLVAAVGANFALPLVTSYTGGNLASTLEANGSKAILDLSALTTFSGASGGLETTIRGVFGGKVDVSGVTSFSGTTEMIAHSAGGEVRLRAGPVTMQGVRLETGPFGTIIGSSIDLQAGSLLRSATIDADVTNSAGTVAPSHVKFTTTTYAGTEILGDYTQTSGGKLSLNIAGTSPAVNFDQLTLTGDLALGGTLELLRDAGYFPALGTAFRIVDGAASSSGFFSNTTGYDIDGTLYFAPLVDATGVTLQVVVAGDASLNNTVDGGDYTLWADNYLVTGAGYQGGDFNSNGLTDGADYTIWADHYGYSAPGAATASAIPEPSTLALTGIGALVLLVTGGRTRRRAR